MNYCLSLGSKFNLGPKFLYYLQCLITHAITLGTVINQLRWQRLAETFCLHFRINAFESTALRRQEVLPTESQFQHFNKSTPQDAL